MILWHNPRCSKSRQTLQLLREHGHEPEIVEYLKTPPSAGNIRKALSLLGIGARDLMRRKESEYKEQGLDDPGLSEETLIAAMVKTPKLIERPILFANGKAAIGRPPENVLGIL